MSKPIVLTGLRANSQFHLGNYLGGILPMIELQKRLGDEYVLNMFIPDLHSFTTEIEYSSLAKQISANISVFVASGLNIDSSDINIYRQSYVPAHSELTIILNNFAYYGELNRMTQFKDKSADNKDNITAGLFDYPVLMAADILLYGAKYIPVGEDQKQHIELTRDIAIRVNNKFSKELFVVPEPWDKQMEFVGLDQAVRIRSLRNPDKKMSKSVSDPAGTILLTDTPDEARKKILAATTDSVGTINYDMKAQPGITNLLNILALLSNQTTEEIKATWNGKTSYGDLKQATADKVSEFLTDIQAKLAAVDQSKIDAKLTQSEKAMNELANQRLAAVQTAIGLRS